MDVTPPLVGKTVVVTRPKRQSIEISQRLNELGARVFSFPLIAIEAPTDKHLSRVKLKKIEAYDYLIFTSRNAVDMAFEVLAELFPNVSLVQLLALKKIAAIGKQTAEALKQQGITPSIVPEVAFNSEALLKHNALAAVSTKHIAIVRGEAGRDLLHSTLQQRGADVEYINVYRRVCPVSNLLPLVKCYEKNGIDIILLTSAEGLTNLFKIGHGQDWLKTMTLLLGSQRMADVLANTSHRTKHQGRVVVADDPSDDKMIDCLLHWSASLDDEVNS